MTRDLVRFTTMMSPIGELLLAGDDAGLRWLSFPSGHKAFGPRAQWRADPRPFTTATAQLRAFFAGELRDFDLALKPKGTAFQQQVWHVLRTIPYGETRSYGWLAKAIGAPTAARAVGAANGANPIPIIVPCHRVIGANGALTGFGGGLATKRFLLDLEAQHGATSAPQLTLL